MDKKTSLPMAASLEQMVLTEQQEEAKVEPGDGVNVYWYKKVDGLTGRVVAEGTAHQLAARRICASPEGVYQEYKKSCEALRRGKARDYKWTRRPIQASRVGEKAPGNLADPSEEGVWIYRRYSLADGQLQLEGTAEELVEAGCYGRISTLERIYRDNINNMATSRKITKVSWSREWVSAQYAAETHEGRLQRLRQGGSVQRLLDGKTGKGTACQRVARQRQEQIGAEIRRAGKVGYTEERLGFSAALPEHNKKGVGDFVPIRPAEGADLLNWDAYNVERINWLRRRDGRRPISYGEWRIGMGAEYIDRLDEVPQRQAKKRGRAG